MNAYDGFDLEESDGPSLFTPEKIIGILRRNVLLISAVVMSVFMIGLGVAYTLPVKYESSTRVLIDSREKNIVDMVDVLSGIETNTPTIESEVEIIKSRAIAVDVINHMNFAGDPEFSGTPGLVVRIKRKAKRLFAKITGKAPTADAHDDGGVRSDLIEAYYGGLGVRRIRNTYLIEIAFEAGSPVKSANIANTIADFYLRHQLNAKIKAAGLATSWLERRIDELRKKVVLGEREIEEFKLRHKMVDTEGHLLNEKQMARAMEQTVLARSKTFEARSKYQQIKKLMERNGSKDSVADVLKSPTIAMLKDQLAKVTRKKAELSTRYGARHPEMRKIAAELGDIKQQLRGEVDRIVANLKNQFDEAEALEGGLRRSLGGLQAKSALSRKASVRLREMQREVKASRLVYEKFLERYKQTAEQEKMQLPDARIVEAALPAGFPSSPKRKRIIAISGAGGLVLAIMLVLAIELVRGGISDPDELKSILKLRHASPVPLLEFDENNSRANMQVMRAIIDDPRSVFSDSIRELRFALDSDGAGQASRVIMVASSNPGEGKSAIASNLAHHFSSLGMRTVLVDCDLRQSALSRTLLPGAQFGMFECLRENQPIDHAIVMDRGSGLYFLPARGTEPTDVSAADVLGSGRMQNALEGLRENFDVTIIDCPPVAPVIDAQIVAGYADQLLFVCSWRDTESRVVEKAFDGLTANNSLFSVAALNKMDVEEFKSSYGYAQTTLSHSQQPRLEASTL